MSVSFSRISSALAWKREVKIEAGVGAAMIVAGATFSITGIAVITGVALTVLGAMAIADALYQRAQHVKEHCRAYSVAQKTAFGLPPDDYELTQLCREILYREED